MKDPCISIVILTARRAQKLLACLRSIEKQTFRSFESIVVDNAGEEETRTIINSLSLSVKLVSAPDAPSYAEARNRGLQNARGEYIAFIDDDCVADPAWLSHLYDIAQNADAVGGMVIPLKKLPFPSWWDQNLNWLVGLSVPGLLDRESGGLHYPQTANMMIRKDVLVEEGFQEIGGEFSHKKTLSYAGREDVELWRRLRLKGKTCRFSPRAVVYHDIPRSRLSLKYLFRRAFNDGLAYFRREKKLPYLSWAVTDIVTFLPDIIRDISSGKNIKQTLVSSSLWRVRQIGFLHGYLFRGSFVKNAGFLFVLFLRKSLSCIFALIKGFVRKAALLFYKSRRGRKKIPRPPKRLLVAACGFLGDMILLSSVLRSLKESLHESQITLLCHGGGAALFKDSGIVDNIIVCPPKGRPGYFKRKNLLKRKLQKSGFDAIMIPYYHNAPVVPLFLGLQAPVITFDRDVGFGRKFWYELADMRIKKDFTLHEIMNLYQLAAPLGLSSKPRPFRFSIPSKSFQKIGGMIKKNQVDPECLILLHPGAGQLFKTWPLENWDRLASLIVQELGIKPVFIGDEKVKTEVALLQVVEKSNAFNFCWKGDLWELAALIKQGNLLVTNDSGPKHLAMALGTPTITLYGTMDERRWGAFWESSGHIALRTVPFDLSPEELLGLPVNYSVSRITPEMVIEKIINHVNSQSVNAKK